MLLRPPKPGRSLRGLRSTFRDKEDVSGKGGPHRRVASRWWCALGLCSSRMARWSPGRRVVVLGAGATRGAEFVVAPNDKAALLRCLPPLNADFFTQLQRI